MTDARYFAYGSNLNIFQMMKRVGEWTTSKRAYLEGYKLVFNVKSPRWGGCAANIQETGNKRDRVYGVVYFLKEKKIPVLTSYESKDPKYRPNDMNVKLEEDDSVIPASVYRFKRGTSGKPSEAYKQTILEGLKQHGYGQDIIEKVQRVFH